LILTKAGEPRTRYRVNAPVAPRKRRRALQHADRMKVRTLD
jgi:hypothetical protein